MSFGEVRSQLFENALKFTFRTISECTKIYVLSCDWGFEEKMREYEMARKCTKIYV